MRLGARKATLAGVLTLAGSLAMLLAGCGGTTGSNAAPDSQQVLHLQSPVSDIKTLDPPNNTDLYSAVPINVLFPGLLILSPTLSVEPWAAQALPTVSSDGLTYTFKVKPGVKWSDGTPITSETYAFSINRALNPCGAYNASYYLYAIKDATAFNGEKCSNGQITGKIQTLIGDSISTPDAQTLVLTLGAPAAYFMEAMTYPSSWAVPEQLIQQYGDKYIDHLADNGGFGGDIFKLTKWDHAGHLVLTRNDNFWGATKPKLREVDITFYKDSTTAYNAYLSGKDDVGAAPASQIEQAKTHAGFHQIAVQQIDYYAMNWTMKPFDDVRMRQAFAIALDKNTIAKDILHGTVQATNHIVPDGMPGYNPALLGPDGTQSLSGNTQKANQLAAAYAADTKCGTATDFSKCPPVVFTITSGSTDLTHEAEAAQQMWLKAMPNYPITISTIDFGTLLSQLSVNKAQFWAIAWIEDYPDPQDWLSTNLACDSAYNSGLACDKQADALMKAADANPDPSRLQQYQQAEQILVTQVAWLPIDQATAWWEVKPWVQNFTIGAGGLTAKDDWVKIYITSH